MYSIAIDWLRRAGDFPQAQQVLGLLYLRQPQLAADGYDQAKRLFMTNKTAVSCFNLGTMYNGGLGVRQDTEQAIRWFVEGGLKGLRRAKFQAGLLYFCDAQTNRESAKLAYYWLHQALKKRGNKKNDVAAKKLRELIDMVDYDIESLAKNYHPYKSRRQVYHSEDDREDDEDDNDEDGSESEDDEDVEMGIQPESSAMAASNNMMQSQATFIPFNNNIAQPESSSMPLSNSSTNMAQQSESARIRQLEQLNKSYKSTIKKLEDKLHIYRRTRGDHIHKLERSNKVLTKRVGDMEKLYYAIAGNDINNP
jgi:hypothetical protein